MASVHPWFPSSGKGKGFVRFIYYDSLLSSPSTVASFARLMAQTYKGAVGYLSQHLDEETFSIDSMETALNFLKVAAEQEKLKETAYINAFLKKHNIKSIQPPQTMVEWINFLTYIDEIQTGSRDFLKRVEEEAKRIRKNQEYMKEAEARIKKEGLGKEEAKVLRRGYDRNVYERARTTVRSQVNQALTNTFKRGSFADDVAKYIATNFPNEIANCVLHNPQNLSTLMAYIQSYVSSYIYFDLQKTVSGKNGIYTAAEKRTVGGRQEALSRLLDEGGVTQALRYYLSSARQYNNFVETMDSMFRIVGLEKKELEDANKINTEPLSKRRNRYLKEFNVDEELQKQLLSDDGAKTFNVKTKISVEVGKESEIASTLRTLSTTAISNAFNSRVLNTGTSNLMVDDEVAISISVEGQEAQDWADEQIAKATTKFKNSYTALSSQFGGKRDAETTKTISRMYAVLREDLENIQKQVKSLYNESAELFISAESNKNYQSFGIKDTYKFEGASLGSDIVSQIENLDKYAAIGGFSIQDREWLLTAIINSGTGMAGHFLKDPLTRYISTFAASMMFGDYESMANSYIRALKEGYSEPVKGIHIYTLNNNIKLPSSIILSQIYNNLTTIAQRINETVSAGSDKAISISIEHNNLPYGSLASDENLTEKKWEDYAEQMISQVSLKLKFMGGFLDLLESFFDPSQLQ